MTKRFTDKVVLVTGASGGLGKITAEKFAQEGAKVAIHYNGNREKALAAAAEFEEKYGGEYRVYGANISEEEAVNGMIQQIIEDFGTLDILVNNAGISLNGSTWKYKMEDWDKVIGINLTGPFLCTKAALPVMREKKYGRIINLSSVVGIKGAAGTIAYASSKSALVGMMKTVAREVAHNGITVNCVAPGYMNAGVIADVPQKYLEETVIPSIPMKHLGDAEDIANAVAFLASDEAKYITGTLLPVDGGFSM